MLVRAKFDRTKPHANIGTIGQVDHSQSSLTVSLERQFEAPLVPHDKDELADARRAAQLFKPR